MASSGNWGVGCASCPNARGVIANKKPANRFVVRFINHLFRKTKHAGELNAHPNDITVVYAHHFFTWWRTTRKAACTVYLALLLQRTCLVYKAFAVVCCGAARSVVPVEPIGECRPGLVCLWAAIRSRLASNRGSKSYR